MAGPQSPISVSLNLHAAVNCKYVSVRIRHTVTTPTIVTLQILNAAGTDISGTISPSFTITSTSGPIKYAIPVSDLSITNGLITIKIIDDNTGNELDQKSVLLHCDIDCCLTKLTNELIDCACDCAKCSASLAKAQKVFLLIQSADYAIVQANDAPDGTRSGFLQDANDKYLKAKEICDESCGCDC